MKGIYLTQEGKQELEAKIAEIKNIKKDIESINGDTSGINYALIMHENILSSATILPVAEYWDEALFKAIAVKEEDINALDVTYPNGVIIQNKQ
jgi:hypothetical protein